MEALRALATFACFVRCKVSPSGLGQSSPRLTRRGYEFPARDSNLRHANPSAGNPCPCCCSGGLTPQPKAIFASEVRPLGIPPSQALPSMDLTLPPQPIFEVGICHHEIPCEREVVVRGNHGGEGCLPPN